MIQAKLPDGTTLQFPEGTSEEVIQRVVKQQLGVQDSTPVPAPPAPSAQPGFLDRMQDRIRNSSPVQTVFGGLRGAGSIGATLLTPYDLAVGNTQSWANPERRQAIESGLRELGANPESMSYGAGKLAAEVAGTAGAGGAFAKGLTAMPGAGSTPVVQGFAQALRTGGMSGTNLATRVAGGAASGGLAAGMIDPTQTGQGATIGGALPVVAPVVRATGSGLANMAGMTTGAGDDALRQAFQAGRAGGAQAEAFRSNMRPGQADMLSVLDDARANVEALRQARSAAYNQNMASVRESTKVISTDPIDSALAQLRSDFTFKNMARNPQVLDALNDAQSLIDDFKRLPKEEYHTPEGFDALKQQIRALINRQPDSARDVKKALGGIESNIKQLIVKEAPEYSKAMADYHQASELIDEITRSLSLNERATADTALRKLQSVMRNNANTNYGARVASMEALEQGGGRPLMPQLAGQALNAWMPRGIQRGAGATGIGLLTYTGNLPGAIGMAATSSPRLMGETFYGAGRLAGATDRVVNPAVIEALRQGAYRVGPVIGAQ